MTQSEAIQEVHDRIRQCFTRHKFNTYGDALKWWHQASYENQIAEAGEQGISKFSIDLLWLIGVFGPKEKVDYKKMSVRKLPKLNKPKREKITTTPVTKRKKRF